MNINLRSSDFLNAIKPEEITKYLEAHGWQVVGRLPGKATTWEFVEGNSSADQLNVLVPITTSFADYALRINNLIDTLAEVEQRPSIDIYRDLLTVDEDVLRVRAIHPEAEDGTIPLRDAYKLIDGTYKMLEAAASVVDQKRPYLPSRKPAEVTHFLETARIGQTEIGSYVVVVHLPLNEIETVPQQTSSESQNDHHEEPFSRRVMTTLADALTTLRGMSSSTDMEQAGENEVEANLDRFVEHGGTAELCEAVETLNRSVQEQQVELNFAWSKTLPTPQRLTETIIIDQAIAPITQRFRRTLRRYQQQEDRTIVGPVLRFNEGGIGADEHVIGTVTLRAEIDGRLRNIRIHLRREEDRQLVIRALDKRKSMTATGRFVAYSNYNELQELRNLQLVED